MARLITLLAAALTCLSFATQASARSISIPIDDLLDGQTGEVMTIFGALPTSETAPRIQFLPDALAFYHICFPAATGRNGALLGGATDPNLFAPRPAIECVGLDQDAINIAFALSRAGHIVDTGLSTVALMRGNDVVMTLRLLN